VRIVIARVGADLCVCPVGLDGCII
jgi:hypothetical protein